jgi:hypothetical protein
VDFRFPLSASCPLVCIVTLLLDLDSRGAFGTMQVCALWQFSVANPLAGERELGAVLLLVDSFAWCT